MVEERKAIRLGKLNKGIYFQCAINMYAVSKTTHIKCTLGNFLSVNESVLYWFNTSSQVGATNTLLCTVSILGTQPRGHSISRDRECPVFVGTWLSDD